jgi:hypothetical protein
LDLRVRRSVPAMIGERDRIRGAVVVLVLSSACFPRYEPPTLAEPHATFKVRLGIHAVSGPQLAKLVLVNDHQVDVPNPTTLPGEIARAVLIRPEGTRFKVHINFFHTVTTMRQVSETYSCGTTAFPMTCTRWRTVTETSQVSDGSCGQEVGLGPRSDAVYLMQYDYFGPGRCSLGCFRELARPDGTFQNAPCEPAPQRAPAQRPPVWAPTHEMW